MTAKPSLVTINPERTPRSFISHLKGAAAYVGIGALVHAWFLGPDFNDHSLWSWGYLLAWPIPVLFWLATVILVFIGYAAVLSLTCGFLWVFYCWVIDRRGLRTSTWQ